MIILTLYKVGEFVEYQHFKNILHGRRSIRKFSDRAVDIESVKELIDCARYAPSDTNSQTWEFIALMNRDKIKEISDITWNQLHKFAEKAKENGLEKEARLLVKSFGPYATAFTDAPVLIISLATPYKSKFREKIFDPISFVDASVWEEEGIKSSCLATQNLMLAAHAMGLGTCAMTGPILAAQDQIRSFLNIDSTKQINMVIALGYPTEYPNKLPRKEVDEILHFIL